METGKAASHVRALTRMRLLCCLGLESYSIMPAVLKEMHGLIRSRTNAFVWGDQRRRVESYLSEDTDHAQPRAANYRNESLDRPERVVITRSMSPLRARRGVPFHATRIKRERRVGCAHGYDGRKAPPPNSDHKLRVVVGHSGIAWGAISLRRAASDECFSARDANHLNAIKPYLARALTVARTGVKAPLVDSSDQGLAIVDISGRIQHMSREARRLLFLATDRAVFPERVAGSPGASILPAEAARLCRGLANEIEDTPRDVAPLVWRCRNRWGGFVFRVYRLNHHLSSSAPLIATAIQRQEPLLVRILRHTDELPLSVRQMQVCLLLAAGHSRRAIAAQLGVTEHTAVTFIRQVYRRLQVHTRSELVIKLIAM